MTSATGCSSSPVGRSSPRSGLRSGLSWASAGRLLFALSDSEDLVVAKGRERRDTGVYPRRAWDGIGVAGRWIRRNAAIPARESRLAMKKFRRRPKM